MSRIGWYKESWWQWFFYHVGGSSGQNAWPVFQGLWGWAANLPVCLLVCVLVCLSYHLSVCHLCLNIIGSDRDPHVKSPQMGQESLNCATGSSSCMPAFLELWTCVVTCLPAWLPICLSVTHRGQKYLNIAVVLQDECLTIITCPANLCTCPFYKHMK